jgi:hypothetical protein
MMNKTPTSNNFLWSTFTLKKPFSTPKTTAAILEKVTTWLAIAIETKLELPKKVLAMSTRYKLERTSSILVPKKASVKEKTKCLPNRLSEIN